MTVTIETTPEREELLEREAERRGLSAHQLAQSLLDEMLQDLEDDARAAHILETTKPSEWRSLGYR